MRLGEDVAGRDVAGGSMTRTRQSTREPVAGPAARRMRRAPLGDLRLWLGVGLLAGSAAVGAVVLSSADASVIVWRAQRDLAAGSRPVDLVPVAVAPDVAAAGYLRPGDPMTGVLRWPVSAGELVPASAVASAADEPTREVTIPVDPLHAPADLQVGDLVDVWSSVGSADSGAAPEPRQVLEAATVAGLGSVEMGLRGEVGVVLEVAAAEVPTLVGAARGGVLDLVAVPAGSQQVRP